MRFAITLTIISLAVAAQAGVAHQDEPYAVAARADTDEPVAALEKKEEAGLEKRACNYNGCKCNSHNQQLTVCGNCVWSGSKAYIVTSKRIANHIYECSPSGRCCDYGPGKDCGSLSARCILN
ncbi:hypothetical protein CORC01_05601 [Colletotrichum orchidophilum]|uniref:Mold-specific m46 protein n=1 Tax=Colletotrichum orchidophilum TaxID=1209926 RepID=A0A1G4BCH3_9PEZI|nr:uncharacterized protein CORC01_05601 [Colletotrichum orchidophilum]OHE99108.1 hypothetical protein CORC01_05601 [Colletotrichum orchidophilum]